MHHAQSSREQSRHDPALDGIRGLAILLVLAHHLFYIGDTLGNPVLQAIHRVQLSAWLGVDLFFALSGYLITGILWRSLGGPGYFRAFYMRRSLRIWPLYYGVLLVLGALSFHLYESRFLRLKRYFQEPPRPAAAEVPGRLPAVDAHSTR